MKNWMLLLPAIMAFLGALGLFMFGYTIVQVVDLIYFRPGDPSVISVHPLALFSLLALVAGFSLSSMFNTCLGDGQLISNNGRFFHFGSGTSLLVASLLVAWVIRTVQGTFWEMATSGKGLGGGSLLKSVEPTLTAGFSLCALAGTGLLLSGLFARPRQQPPGSQATDVEVRPATKNLGWIAVFSGLVSLGMLCLLVSIWNRSGALDSLLKTESGVPDLAMLSQHIMGISNQSLVVFLGLAVVGLLHALGSLFQQTVIPQAPTS